MCTNVLLKIDVFKNILCTGHPTVRMALQGTFPLTFLKWNTAKQITNEPTPCFIKRPFNQPIILLSTVVSGF